MVQKAFNDLAVLFFIPLVFIGAFFLLNLTLAVIKSKFTEEHNQRKKKMVKGVEAPEEIEKKMEAEKSRINRKIKPQIKKRLFELLDKARKRLETDVDKSKLKHRMSIAGALRRDLFGDEEEELGSPTKLKAKFDELEEQKVCVDKSMKRKNTLKSNKGLGKMDDESSFDASSGSSSSSGGSKESHKSSSSGSGSSSEPEKLPSPKSKKKGKNSEKMGQKKTHLQTLKIGGKNKWRNRLNISRETIVEVDEEHKSDTTNRMSKHPHFSQF